MIGRRNGVDGFYTGATRYLLGVNDAFSFASLFPNGPLRQNSVEIQLTLSSSQIP